MVSVTTLPGVGKTRAAQLEKLGVRTLEELLALYPHRYEDRYMVIPIEEITMHMGENVSIVAAVTEPPRERRIYGGKTLTTAMVADRTGMLTLTFFNNPYIKRTRFKIIHRTIT